MISARRWEALGVVFTITIALIFIPLRQLDILERIPGDFIDGRLNNYFLEHVHQFLAGNQGSLTDLQFYFPFPGTVALSDNLWGSAPFYSLYRFLGAAPDTAFQLWWLSSYILNFLSAYISLRILKLNAISALFGALIFSFALPAVAHSSMHAQLAYRCGIPVAFSCYTVFLRTGKFKWILVAAAATVWQFYATIYVGLFLGLGLFAYTFAYFAFTKRPFVIARALCRRLLTNSSKSAWGAAGGSIALAGLLGCLFWPYLNMSEVYGDSRPWYMVEEGLPRIASYFVSDFSLIWAQPNNQVFSSLPYRHEHQMFPGLIVYVSAALGALVAFRVNRYKIFRTFLGAFLIIFLITLYADGVSVWRLIYELPGFGAIRALTRIDLLLVYLQSVLGAVFVNYVLQKKTLIGTVLSVVVAFSALFEMAYIRVPSISKSEWRARLSSSDARVPNNLSSDSILVFEPDRTFSWQENEVLAMWTSIKSGLPTINGYSGDVPPSARSGYFSCEEIALRIAAADEAFPKLGLDGMRADVSNRLVLVGFPNCERDKLKYDILTASVRSQSYDESALVGLRIVEAEHLGDSLRVVVENGGFTDIAPRSLDGSHLKLSWGYVGIGSNNPGYFATRHDWPDVLRAGESLELLVPVAHEEGVNREELWVTIVQENEFWLQDKGMAIYKAAEKSSAIHQPR